MDEQMNAEKISLRAKEFFEKVRGMKAYFFNVSECSFSEDKWKVVCSFVSNPFEGNEIEYDVSLDVQGDVMSVSRRYKKAV